MRRPATPGRTGPQDRATLDGLAQASVPRPLPRAWSSPTAQARTLCREAHVGFRGLTHPVQDLKT